MKFWKFKTTVQDKVSLPLLLYVHVTAHLCPIPAVQRPSELLQTIIENGE